MATLEQKLQELLQDSVEGLGCELWGIECQRVGRYLTVRLFIDKEGGVTIDDCSDVSRQVSPILDVEDPIADKYNLEVSSPGLERALKKLEDYIRFTGEKITLHLKHKLNDKKQFKAVIKEVKGDNIVFLIDKKEVEIEFKEIRKANILFEFNDF